MRNNQSELPDEQDNDAPSKEADSMSQQSPINLQDPIYAELGERGLKLGWDGTVFGKVAEHDEAIKIDIDHDESHFVVLDRKKFHLVGFHFHHPSEHWVNGEQRTMELHVVHQNINDGTYAVVGILIQASESARSNAQLVAFISKVAKILKLMKKPKPTGKHVDTRVSTSPKVFLPPLPEAYYRYEGSLTTPQKDGTTYLETVSWALFKEVLLVKPKDLSDLIKEFKEPARFMQPLDRRFLLATFRSSVES